jgi:hypothetical protein
MSSPKRATRPAAKPTAKTRGAPLRAVKAVAASESAASEEAMHLAATLERSIVDDKLDTISADALQKLMAAACRLYTARAQAGESFTPVPANSISATDVMITASGLLRSANLAVFELGMWQNWTGR